MVIRSRITTDINVTCTADANAPRPSVTTTKPSSTTTGLLEDVSSPVLVLILGSLCVALLLIILIVSVMLCCVMPRKQQAEIRKVRNSMAFVIDGNTQGNVTYRHDSKPTDGDFIRPQSHIYGNAAPKAPGQNRPDYHLTAPRNDLTVPSHNINYSNTSGNRTPALYDNL
ncbi:hypothetical protein DPMN_116477 [Dreissena polymorpha]|uniref:Uncharacterized protein n=1 Tax=Dreissena polymorpha TaxID=45954 RepID=A0A9D4QTF9_DREPO|nr:hypothetical protein DPMN_116477 [Dreissena polymorpha]